MTSIGRHRSCGCDCRDSAIYSPDPLVFNPICCKVCGEDGTSKPPCVYLVNWECDLWEGEGQFALATMFGMPGMELRPRCTFIDSCKFVSFRGDANIPIDNLDGCSWAARCWREWYSNGGHESDVAWQLDLEAEPIEMVHQATGWTYRIRDPWDCYGPNTLYLDESTRGTNKYLPSVVCITPGVTRVTSPNPCCEGCFELTVPDVFTVSGGTTQVPPQRLQFTWIGQAASTQSELLTGACAYSARLLAWGSVTGVGTAWLVNSGPMDQGQATSAVLVFDYTYGYRASPDGTITDFQFVRSAKYQCDNFTCDGGRFYLASSEDGWPRTIEVISGKCEASEQDEYGPCPDMECNHVIPEFLPRNQQSQYDTEENRCNCQDEWCEEAPGGIKLFVNGASGITTVSSFSCNPEAHTGGWMKTDELPHFTPHGYTRKIELSFLGHDGVTTHTVKTLVYCASDNGNFIGWTADFYCDGTYFSSIPLNPDSTCPYRSLEGVPAIPDCDVIGGCIGLNVIPDCDPPTCCDAADEPSTLKLHITSSCLALSGTTVTLNRVGVGHWSGTDLTGYYTINMYCGVYAWTGGAAPDGTWTIQITHSFGCFVNLTSFNVVCSPAMSGSFATGYMGGLCPDAECANGDSVSILVTA